MASARGRNLAALRCARARSCECGLEFGNRRGPPERRPRRLDMQVLDDPAIDHRHPLPGGGGRVMCRDLAAGKVELTSRRTGESEELTPDEAVARLEAIYEPHR